MAWPLTLNFKNLRTEAEPSYYEEAMAFLSVSDPTSNLRRARLVLRWATVSGHLFRYVTNQPPKANSAFHPSRVGKWVPASAGKEKAGVVHSVSGWMRGLQVKLWEQKLTSQSNVVSWGGNNGNIADVGIVVVRIAVCTHTNPRLAYLTLPFFTYLNPSAVKSRLCLCKRSHTFLLRLYSGIILSASRS